MLVIGDRVAEPTETFVVNLTGATNAILADGQGAGTILDDEPRVSISDVAKYEGRKNQATLFVEDTVALIEKAAPVAAGILAARLRKGAWPDKAKVLLTLAVIDRALNIHEHITVEQELDRLRGIWLRWNTPWRSRPPEPDADCREVAEDRILESTKQAEADLLRVT